MASEDEIDLARRTHRRGNSWTGFVNNVSLAMQNSTIRNHSNGVLILVNFPPHTLQLGLHSYYYVLDVTCYILLSYTTQSSPLLSDEILAVKKAPISTEDVRNQYTESTSTASSHHKQLVIVNKKFDRYFVVNC